SVGVIGPEIGGALSAAASGHHSLFFAGQPLKEMFKLAPFVPSTCAPKPNAPARGGPTRRCIERVSIGAMTFGLMIVRRKKYLRQCPMLGPSLSQGTGRRSSLAKNPATGGGGRRKRLQQSQKRHAEWRAITRSTVP